MPIAKCAHCPLAFPHPVASSITHTTSSAQALPGQDVALEQAVLAALAPMASVDVAITRDAELAALEIDSLDLVELTQILDEERQLRIEPAALKNVTTVGEVIDIIVKREGAS